MFKFVRSKSVWLILPFYCCFRFLFSEISLRTFLFCLEFSGLHYCLFVKVLFFLLEVFPEELSFLSLRQLIEFIISSSVCQELFSFCFQVSFKTRLLITRSNSSLVYQNFQLVSSIFYFLNFFSEIRVAFDCRNSHKFYQDYWSMSSAFSSFLKKKFHRIPCGGTSV